MIIPGIGYTIEMMYVVNANLYGRNLNEFQRAEGDRLEYCVAAEYIQFTFEGCIKTEISP